MLVHGAWHRPNVWAKLEAELHALSYATRTPALPSSGDQPTAGVHDDAAVLARELASVEGLVVLLAHSTPASRSPRPPPERLTSCG